MQELFVGQLGLDFSDIEQAMSPDQMLNNNDLLNILKLWREKTSRNSKQDLLNIFQHAKEEKIIRKDVYVVVWQLLGKFDKLVIIMFLVFNIFYLRNKFYRYQRYEITSTDLYHYASFYKISIIMYI